MIRILLADDHALVRSGIRMLLERAGDMEVIAETPDGREATRLTKQMLPDLAILDVAMPNLNGIEAARQIRTDSSVTRVIMLSMHGDPKYIHESMKAGAAGYVLKESVFDELLTAIRTVMSGRKYLSPTMAAQIQSSAQTLGETDTSNGLGKLSRREREVLQLIGEGHSNPEIAGILEVGVRTVETHREHIIAKLNIHSVAGLTRFAIRNGLCALEQ